MMGPAVVVALLGLMQTASAFTPICAVYGTCNKPTSSFPKLDKAACEKKFPTLDSFTCDVWDNSYPTCAALGSLSSQRTFPNKCALERYICVGLMAGGPASGKYLYDGKCTYRGAWMCPMRAVPPGSPQVCAKLGNDPPSKANLQVFKSATQLWKVKCSIPTLKTVKMDVCKAAGVVLKPRPPIPQYEKDCMAMSLKCDPKLRGSAVCGDDGVTYPQACHLYYDNCIARGKFGKGAKQVKLAADGACPISCDPKTPCPAKMDCIGTCVPTGLDSCAGKNCPAGQECLSAINRKINYPGYGHPFSTKCLPTPATPFKCDLAAMTKCIRSVMGVNAKSIAPCGVLMASATCAINTRCMTAAKRFCNSGVLINSGAGGKTVMPKNCNVPACKKAIDKKCQAGAYQKCADKTYNNPNLCGAYTDMAKCISKYNCDEDLEATCYMAKWDNCKSQELKDACKTSQSPIKEMSEEYYQVFQYAKLERPSSSQSKSHAGVMAGVGCAALVAVGLAAFLIRRRRTHSESEEAATADYHAVEEEA